MEVQVDGIGSSPVPTNKSPPTADESTSISNLRSILATTLDLPHIKKYGSLTHDWFLLRFIRGYNQNVEEAAKAYIAMSSFRLENDVASLTDELLRIESETGVLPYPYELESFKELRECLGKDGLMLVGGGEDRNGNLITSVDVGSYDLRKVMKHNLCDILMRGSFALDAYFNLVLHRKSCELNKLYMRHDLLNVASIGFFQFTPAALRLMLKIMNTQKHYPESTARITSCGNTAAAVLLYNKIIRPFVPKRVTDKVAVLGKKFTTKLLEDVEEGEMPEGYLSAR